jgi:signal peptidase I
MTPSSRSSRFMKAVLGRTGGEVLLLVLSLLGLYFFAYRRGQFFRVPSGSMEPTLRIGDQIVTMKESAYGRGDIVVLADPEDAKSYIVKRIAAVGGDTVFITGGALYVNGEYVSEPYAPDPANYLMKPYTVPEGRVFLLGDNRNNSDDSHLWEDKARPLSDITGKVRFIYYPYDRAGVVRGYPPVTPDPSDRSAPHGPQPAALTRPLRDDTPRA